MVLTVWPHECVATRRASTLKEIPKPEEHVLDRCDPIGPAMPVTVERDGTAFVFKAGGRMAVVGLGAEANASTTDEDA